MNYSYLLKHRELFQYVIGITYKEFQELLLLFIISALFMLQLSYTINDKNIDSVYKLDYYK